MTNYRKSIVTFCVEPFARWQLHSIDASPFFTFNFCEKWKMDVSISIFYIFLCQWKSKITVDTRAYSNSSSVQFSSCTLKDAWQPCSCYNCLRAIRLSRLTTSLYHRLTCPCRSTNRRAWIPMWSTWIRSNSFMSHPRISSRRRLLGLLGGVPLFGQDWSLPLQTVV